MIDILSDEKLEKLNTKRLLALYKSIRNKIRSPYFWDNHSNAQDVMEYKDRIKKLLDDREHVN